MGAIDQDLPPILTRLELPEEASLNAMRQNPMRGRRTIGAIDKLKAMCDRLGQQWLWGMRPASLSTAKLKPT